MDTAKALSWTYAEEFPNSDDVVLAAQTRAKNAGVYAPTASAGSVLRTLAAAIGAKAVVEVGTGTGVGSLWLLQGMPEDGVLTTIDVEADHHRMAKEFFIQAGIAPTRTRTIAGRPLEVLPRLTDAAYDMVVINPDPINAAAYVEQGLRLLRNGGVLVVDSALWEDQVGDPAQRDPSVSAIRDVGRAMRDDERLWTALLPAGEGMLIATKR